MRLHVQVLQAAFHERGQVLAVISIRRVRLQPAPGLGRHIDGFLALPPQFRHQALAPPVSIDVRRVDEIDPQVDGPLQRFQ